MGKINDGVLYDYELALSSVARIHGWAFEKLMDFRMMYRCDRNGHYTRTEVWPNFTLTPEEIDGAIRVCDEEIDEYDCLVDSVDTKKEVFTI